MEDYELNRPSSPVPAAGRAGGSPPLLPVALVATLVVAVLGGGWWWLSRAPSASPTAPPGEAVMATEAPVPPPATAAAPELPPLDAMDPFVRKLVGALSSRPLLARWLATGQLVQQLAAAIDVAAQGRTPARDLKAIAPEGPFTTERRGRTRIIDPASYRRYDPLALAITSIDASAAGAAYKTLHPRLDEAYRRLGRPGGGVDRALAEALRILLDTPVLKDPVAVVEGKGARWAYADPAVESLTASQKQLLRMGPANVERVLVWLRAFRQHAGV